MNNLSNLRKQAGMSQSDLAEILGVLQQTISKYENGSREPDNKTLIKLSKIFYCSIDYLLGHSNVRLSSDQILNVLGDDPELAEFWDRLKEREDLRLLIREIKDISPTGIHQVIRIIKAIENDPI